MAQQTRDNAQHDEVNTAEGATFSIGELAKELGISTRTIRFYEERGLLNPTRSDGRHRIYTRRDRGHLKLIVKHRDAGFTLDEMKELLAIYDTHPDAEGTQRQLARFREILTRHIEDVDAQIETLLALKTRMQERLTYANRELRKRQDARAARRNGK
ncbi:MAG: MerR family transcriptional regulator [Anaerolineae bacterium]|nr:MerR family transcriptional regulator [Anaerolineae bacterium]